MTEVVLAILSKEGKVLAVSRKNNKNDFGLPGGKVESGETVQEALVREVLEETGFLCEDSSLSNSSEYNGAIVHCFEIHKFRKLEDSKEDGVIKWVSRDFLKQPIHSFWDYNEKVL